MSTALRIQNMFRSREPGTFFGGGVVAGLLLFLVWFALLPSTRKTSAGTTAESISGQSQGPAGANGAILSAITGSAEIEGDSFGSADSATAIDDAATLAGVEDGDVPFTGEFGDADSGSGVTVDGSQPPQDGFLEAHAEIDGVAVPNPLPEIVLQPWFVEVLRDGGQVEILEVNAQSSEHALAIVRDYRGNPQIVRAPSTRSPD